MIYKFYTDFFSKLVFSISSFNFFIFQNSRVSFELSKYVIKKTKKQATIIQNIIIAILIFKDNNIHENINQTIDQIQENILYFDIKDAYSEGLDIFNI